MINWSPVCWDAAWLVFLFAVIVESHLENDTKHFWSSYVLPLVWGRRPVQGWWSSCGPCRDTGPWWTDDSSVCCLCWLSTSRWKGWKTSIKMSIYVYSNWKILTLVNSALNDFDWPKWHKSILTFIWAASPAFILGTSTIQQHPDIDRELGQQR